MGVLIGPASSRNPRHPGWPAELGPLPSRAGAVRLRPLRRRDGAAWRRLRLRDRELIERWDATSPLSWTERHSPAAWRAARAALGWAARRGTCLPFAVIVDDEFVGQVTLGGIQRGSVSSAWVGYWVSSEMTGHGVATGAVALAVAHALGPVGLHRVEATIAPENAASRAVVGHLGMREEGLLRRYLDIAGAWRDHLLFALTVEEMPGGSDPALALVGAYLRRGEGRCG
ncbi:MAG: GNAT family N-acetyltransferase [Actinobacteria bacterium 69-20]|jgi:ribosomal-protein-alanine N-acetyltransferase|nr:GNAT family N-acetyltransferase [Actinomycetota bacterium]OJV28027.1 MAG: GNAT family N-acetyltransferase [Actinobacteria bacterium 69-20]